MTIIALWILAWASVARPPALLVLASQRLSLTYPAMLATLAAALAALAAITSVIFEQQGQHNFTPVLLMWISSGALYLSAFTRRLPTREGLMIWLQAHRRELLGLGGLILLGAFLRFYKLGDIPRIINGDEGLLGQAALLTEELPLANPFALFENFGALYMQAIGLALNGLGVTPFALRLLPAIGGTAAILAVYLLGRQLLGKYPAFVAACLLAVSHSHIHFSRTVAVGYIQGTLLAPLILYFFFSGLVRRGALRMAAGGLLLGAYFSVYLDAQILAAFIGVYALIALAVQRSLIRGALRPLAVFAAGAVLSGLPQLAYSLRQPDQFLARLNSDGTFQSGWLAERMAESGQSAPGILANRLAHAFLSLVHYPAQEFYGASIPLLGIITGACFLLGLGLCLVRTRRPDYLLLNGYFWSMTVAVGVFAIPPAADSYRMLIALPPAVLMAAVALTHVFQVLGLDQPERRLARVGALTLVLALALAFNVRAYFIDFAGQCRYGGDRQTRFASYLGSYLRTLDPSTTVYLLSNADLLYGTHSSVDFLSRGLPVTNVPGPASEIAAGPLTAVIAIEERRDELRAWANLHRGGTFARAYDCQRLMLVAYQLP